MSVTIIYGRMNIVCAHTITPKPFDIPAAPVSPRNATAITISGITIGTKTIKFRNERPLNLSLQSAYAPRVPIKIAASVLTTASVSEFISTWIISLSENSLL